MNNIENHEFETRALNLMHEAGYAVDSSVDVEALMGTIGLSQRYDDPADICEREYGDLEVEALRRVENAFDEYLIQYAGTFESIAEARAEWKYEFRFKQVLTILKNAARLLK